MAHTALIEPDPSVLPGIWTTSSAGSMSDYNLIFRPDGAGRAEFVNCCLTNAFTFRWQLSSDQLSIHGEEAIESNDAQDNVVHLPWSTTQRRASHCCHPRPPINSSAFACA